MATGTENTNLYTVFNKRIWGHFNSKNIIVVPGQELVNQGHEELKTLILKIYLGGFQKFKSH